MQIHTSRFGLIDVDAERIMTFKGGLLGFPEAETFALIQTGDDNYFFWLQSTEDPNLAFVVTDPSVFLPDYTVEAVPLREEARAELALPEDMAGDDLVTATQVFVICNRVGEWLTGNLLGPLVINVATCQGKQIVLTERRWSTRQPLLRLQVGVEAQAA